MTDKTAPAASSNVNERSVVVSNVSTSTTEQSLRNFFEFCGSIESIKIDSASHEATVVFKGEGAAKTAVMLNGGQVDGNSIKIVGKDGVTSETSTEKVAEATSKDASGAQASEEGISQEAKPKSAILAELLAHGYTLGDQVIQRGIDIDKKHGFSEKFIAWFKELLGRGKQWDEKTHATEKATEMAQKVDQQAGVQDKAKQAYKVGQDYYHRALASPTGARVQAFYQDASKQVADVHAEAARIAEAKKAGGSASETATGTAETAST